MFLQGIVRVSNIAKVSHGILINIMVFKGIQCPFGGIGPRIMNIPQVFIRFWEVGYPMSQNGVLPMVFLTFWSGLEASR